MSDARRSTPSRAMKLTRARSWKSCYRLSNCFCEQRTIRWNRSMWGSSLGGVVSFYSAWEYPGVFGGAVCMSSTFPYKDDLIERVLSEPTRDARFYLDSGWPNDNYEVTTEMALALVSRGGDTVAILSI